MRAGSIERSVCPQALRRVVTCARCSVAARAPPWGHAHALQQRGRVCRDIPDKPHARPDVRVARAAAGQWGVLSLDELFACGLSRGAVSGRVLNGRLHLIHRGVYAVGHANLSLEGRFLAAVKACGAGAVLSHHSAAALWGFMQWEERHPEVTVVGTAARRAPGPAHPPNAEPRPRRPHPPPRHPRHLARPHPPRPRGHARPPSRCAPPPAAPSRSTASTCASSPRPSPATRRRGAARLAQIIATGPAPTKSELEDVVLDLILRGGHVHPDVNVALLRRGPPNRPRLPLARAAPRRRGRRRGVARQPARARGRRRAPGAAGGARRAGPARHLGAGDRASGRPRSPGCARRARPTLSGR